VCFEKDPELKETYEKKRDNPNRSEYFSPLTTSECLNDCKSMFYFTFKRMTKYFADDKGFYIESGRDF
jgi:hypothetical protein